MAKISCFPVCLLIISSSLLCLSPGLCTLKGTLNLSDIAKGSGTLDQNMFNVSRGQILLTPRAYLRGSLRHGETFPGLKIPGRGRRKTLLVFANPLIAMPLLFSGRTVALGSAV